MDYPSYEVIVVNDGSTDDTAGVVRRYLHTGVVRLLDKTVNEGKAMGLNDAIPLCRGEIVVVLDADIVVTPGVLRALVPHFESPRVGAVTGNPRVANRGSLLRNLQTLEFASIVSVQRRAQRIWGRVLTVSGAIAAFRKTALVDVGLFSPDMATEDIDMTWKLQRRFWDVRYEASAVVWMEVPPTLGELWKQRRRWARGLAQVLSKHRDVTVSWKAASSVAGVLGRRAVHRLGVHVSHAHHVLGRLARARLLAVRLITDSESLGNADRDGVPDAARDRRAARPPLRSRPREVLPVRRAVSARVLDAHVRDQRDLHDRRASAEATGRAGLAHSACGGRLMSTTTRMHAHHRRTRLRSVSLGASRATRAHRRTPVHAPTRS